MPAAADSDFVQSLEYNHFTNPHYNVDFKGAGELRINAEGTTYTFTGTRRGSLGSKSGEMKFHAEDIRNVEVNHAIVRFTTGLGKSGRNKVPFVFHLPDERTAHSIAALLPDHKDETHTEAQDFAARLDEIAGPADGGLSLTKIIIGLNVLVFVIMGLLGAGWIQTESMLPYILYGANNGAATTDGEWWRLLTSMFMHFGILHLALNMWALYAAGGFLERILGPRSFLFTYVGAGLAGGFASIAWYGDRVWSAGASGAVFGVFGALLGYVLRQKQAIPRSVYQSMLKSSLSFAGYNILFGLVRPGIDNAAHLGGLAGGFVFAWILALPLNREVRARQSGRRLQLGLVALVLLAATGVATTPRFDYTVSDAMTWNDVNRPFITQEVELQTEQQKTLANLGFPEQATALTQLIETRLIPFYEEWTRSLAPLRLNPEKQTAQARDSLTKILAMKLDNYRQLVADLRAQDPAAISHYEAAEAQVVAAITQMQSGR